MPRRSPTPQSTAPASSFYRNDEPVLYGYDTPRFGDAVWEFPPLMRSQAERAFDLRTIADGWRLTAREMCMALAQPDHQALIHAGVIRRARPTKPRTLFSVLAGIRALALWAAGQGIATPEDLTQDDCLRFHAALIAGDHAPGARPLTSSSIAKFLEILRRLHEFRSVLTNGGLAFDPLDGRSATTVAGYVIGPENINAPLPFDQWSTAMRAAWTIVDSLSADIITAERQRRALPQDTNGTVTGAAELITSFVAAGGKIPLSTGRGRNPRPRGEPSYRLLARLLGFSGNCLNKAASGYRPDVVELLDAYGSDPDTSVYGGLHVPTASVMHDGVVVPWGAEFGTYEAEHLTSVLRAAAYLLLCALTAMRDSEVQELSADAIATADGLPGIRSRQFKGEVTEHGRDRVWFAPAPVLRVVEVLAKLTPDPSMLFARAAGGGSYDPQRDIPRFVAFVNAEPDDRVGRGCRLFEGRLDRHVTLNQQTMRRSFAVYAARYPEAELGLGIQLGHAALRMTAGYFLDSQEKAARLFDTDRRKAAGDLVRSIVIGTTPATGPGAHGLRDLHATVVTDDGRAERLLTMLAERYHLGTLNDCHFRAELSQCGPDGPHLSEKRCTTVACHNAVVTSRHADAWTAQQQRIDEQLDRDALHPIFRERLAADRSHIHDVIVELRRNER